MSQQRPDLLPFALPKRIGLPFHGVCKGGKIGTKDYPQPNTGDAVLVQHPLSFAPTLPNGDDESWQQYALLSGANYCLQIPGSNRQIGGQSIGDNEWIYCDSKYSWLISFEFSKADITQTIKVWLESCFGLFPVKTMTRRQLCEITYTPLTYAGANQSTALAALARRFLLSHSKTGDKTIINVAAYTTSSQPWTYSCLPYDVLRRAYGAYGIHNALLITVSGDGSVASGKIGDGISATIASQRTAPEMIVSNTSSSSSTGEYYGEFFLAGDCIDNCDQFPCPDPPPASGELYATTHWSNELYLGSGETSQEGPKTATKTDLIESEIKLRYLDTVKPEGALSYLEIVSTASAETTYQEDITGTLFTEWDGYVLPEPYAPCSFGTVNLDWYKTSRRHSGSSDYAASKTFTGEYSVSISWCGASKEFSYVKTGSENYSFSATYWEGGTSYGGPALGDSSLTIDDYECSENAAAIACADIGDVLIYRITNGLVGVFEDGLDTSTLLTLVGTEQAAAGIPAATEASLNPATGAIEYDAGKAVCYV